MYIIFQMTAELLLENGYLEKLPHENLNEPFDNSIFLGIFDDGVEDREANKIYYVRMNENTGGYDWLWLMEFLKIIVTVS